MRTWMIVLCGLVVGFGIVAGCKDDEQYTAEGTVQVTPASAPAEALPTSLIATTQPAGEAKDVAALKKAGAKDGDKVVVRGKVAGSADPLADNRAIMTLLDAGVKTCDSMPGDACKTPWDACCEPAEVLQASTATVQVVGGDGKPLKATLDGAGGIKPLKQVVVAGVVRLAPGGGDALVIEANEIYVAP